MFFTVRFKTTINDIHVKGSRPVQGSVIFDRLINN